MSTDPPSALARVAHVLSATATRVAAGEASSDLVWFEVDAAVDELFEATGDQAWAMDLCDAVAACVPLARTALARGDVDAAVAALREAETRVREAIERR